MARPALATVADIEALLGDEITDPHAQVRAEALLAMASEIVRAYAATTWLNTDEDAVEDVPEQIPLIVAAVVERATRNPMGITQEAAGPFSRSFGADASQRLYLTKAERMVIRSTIDRRQIGALGTSRGDLETPGVGGGSGGLDGLDESTDPFNL